MLEFGRGLQGRNSVFRGIETLAWQAKQNVSVKGEGTEKRKMEFVNAMS